MGSDTKRRLALRKIHFFVTEKCIEDAKQDEKHILDLLESTMRPTCLVKAALRQISSKLGQFRPEITKIWV